MTRNSRIALMIGLIFFALLIVARLLFPLKYYESTKKFDFWRHGVRQFHAQDMSGWERDNCDANDPEARGCTCIALLHGLGDEPATFSKLLMAPKSEWNKPVKLFAPLIPHNQRYVPGDPKSEYRVRNQAAWIASRLAPLCPSWIVVGNSLGGWEAAWIALDKKLPVQKLILIDAVGTRASDIPSAVKLFTDPTASSMKELLSKIYYKAPVLSEGVWKRVAEMEANAHLGDVIGAQTQGDLLDGRLGTLRVPTMVIWGAGDRLIPDRVGNELRADIPGALWREIPECGHMPQKECPVPVIQAINQMLQVGTM